jgi:hypothetical protein
VSTVLEEAAEAVSGDRQRHYGHPLDNHSRTAALWSAYLRIDITAEQVCQLNILQKISRATCDSSHRDTWVDIAGYAQNVVMVQEERQRRDEVLRGCER